MLDGVCEMDQILCDDGRTCLSYDKKCNGVQDCPGGGGADERDCQCKCIYGLHSSN